jgi:hypothetical protein
MEVKRYILVLSKIMFSLVGLDSCLQILKNILRSIAHPLFVNGNTLAFAQQVLFFLCSGYKSSLLTDKVWWVLSSASQSQAFQA